jgi:hypothetical protein
MRFDHSAYLSLNELLGHHDDLDRFVKHLSASWFNVLSDYTANTICASAKKSGMHTAMAMGVPTLVDAPMYAEGFASGMPARRVGGPEMSEFDAAITARRTTPPGLNPASTCAM